MSETYEHRDMTNSVFRDVNLHGAVFNDVNLAESSIKNATLKNMVIDDVDIEGLTIFGMRIDLLISEEMNRRDPERVRLRMSDPGDPRCVRAVFERLNQVRAEFEAKLRQVDPKRLLARPAPDEWNALECVRHMLFAEDMYLNRFILRNELPLNKLGQLPAFATDDAEFPGVGSGPVENLEAVLAAWEGAHANMLAHVAGATAEELGRMITTWGETRRTVGSLLQIQAEHDLEHIRQAERAL